MGSHCKVFWARRAIPFVVLYNFFIYLLHKSLYISLIALNLVDLLTVFVSKGCVKCGLEQLS